MLTHPQTRLGISTDIFPGEKDSLAVGGGLQQEEEEEEEEKPLEKHPSTESSAELCCLPDTGEQRFRLLPRIRFGCLRLQGSSSALITPASSEESPAEGLDSSIQQRAPIRESLSDGWSS